MLCSQIYKKALRLIGEIEPDDARTEDYMERAPYILANAVSDLRMLDSYYRRAFSLGEQALNVEHELCLPLSEPFPLSDRFVGAVSAYLASILLIDEDSALSDKLYDKFCLGITAITQEIPAERQKILDMYK
ncbi:MAG: hypothetical protein IJW69_00830 [Clostridia bacterium]|nr:hypothetical protein [Clostridia bacterium]